MVAAGGDPGRAGLAVARGAGQTGLMPTLPNRPAATAASEPSSGAAAAVMMAVIVIWGLGPPITKLISAPALVAVSTRFWVSVPLVWILTYATGGRVTKEVLRRTALP